MKKPKKAIVRSRLPHGRLDEQKEKVALTYHPMLELRTVSDWKNTLALAEHLQACHHAVLHVPGIDIALKSIPGVGIHCYDPSFRFIGDLLYEVECQCRKNIEIQKLADNVAEWRNRRARSRSLSRSKRPKSGRKR